MNRLRYKHRQYESVKVLLQIQSKVSPVVWLCRTEWSLGWVNWGVCVCVCVYFVLIEISEERGVAREPTPWVWCFVC